MPFETAISVCACRLKAGVWHRLAFAAVLGFTSALFAAEVTPTDAARAAKAWVDRGYAMGVFTSERTVAGVDGIEDATTGARLYVVKFEGGGFVVLSANDLVDPVLAFSATGSGVAMSDDNPLWTLLRGAIAAREAAAGVVRGTGSASGRRGPATRARLASVTSTAAQRKWSALLGAGTRMLSTADADAPRPTLSDIRVSPFVLSKWGQDYDIYGNKCFNYFTPNEYPCGCVATTGAQVMRYLQWPAATTILPPFTNPDCKVDGVTRRLTTQGGSYNWADMPLDPEKPIDPEDPSSYASEANRQAIGKLTSDIGICCGMSYRGYVDGGSSAGLHMLAQAFMDHFNYGSALAAQWDDTTDVSRINALKSAVISNLDAGLPVIVGLVGVTEAFNHTAVVDGYGYSDDGLFLHMNFGWYGEAEDVWYAPSNITTDEGDPRYNYTVIDGFVFNIFTNLPSSTVICSGRVLDANGNPVVGAVVSYCPEGSSLTTTGDAATDGATSGGTSAAGTVGHVVSNAKGIYALTLPPGTYKVYTSYGDSSTPGAAMEALRYVTLSPNYPNGYPSNPSPVINNLIDQDLVLSNLESVAVPVFNPSSCFFYPATNVSISCATSGAMIRYTLDGTEPTETSAVYTDPIAISDNVVITVKAWVDGMNPSANSATYTCAPGGDYFADPILISGASGTHEVADNSDYTVEQGEPPHTIDDNGECWLQYNTIWYEWTAPGSGLMTFTARLAGYYTLPPLLAVYTGDSLSTIERIAYDDDKDGDYLAVATFNVQQGTTYRIVGMSGSEGDYGAFTLAWSGDLVVEPTVTPLEVMTSVLPSATSGVPYAVTLEATGGVAPYAWSVAEAALPGGLSLSPAGVLSGTPTASGVEAVTVFVTDDAGTRVGRTFTLTVEAVEPDVEPVPVVQYAVRFDANSGMGDMDDQIIAVGETQDLDLCRFKRVGYTFAGWAREADGKIVFANGATVSNLTEEADGTVTLYAVWAVNQYTLSFDSNGGSAVAQITQDYDTAVTAPAAPVRTGYTFAGWQPALLSTVPASNVTFTAQWTVNQYTLTFDANGGSKVDPITQDYGTEVAAPAEPTQTGYTFAGWHPALVLTVPASNVTYMAQWKVNSYTVTFDANGGEEGGIEAQNGVYGTAFSVSSNRFTRVGHTFAGWATNVNDGVVFADGATVSNLTAEADGFVTLYAVWDVNQYTLTFDANGGSEVAPITQDYATAVAAPAAPVRTGYTFVGWTPELPEVMPAENPVLTAQWKVNGLIVTFNANGGTVKEDERVVTKGKTVGTLPKPTRTGYTFNGWYTKTSGGTKVKTSTKVKKDVTYYAQWTANKYTIKFNKNGGTRTMKSLTATYDKVVTLTANAFKRTNWTFLGWATEKDDTEATYTNKAKVKNLSAKSGGTVTLYAVWKRNTYTVKFNANGGTGASQRQTLNCGSSVKLAKNTYEREGFVFAGWATKKDGKVVYKNKAMVKDLAKKGKSVTLYAVWKPASWAVGTFTDKNGTIAGKAATVKLTVASDGKISGKFVRTRDKKSFSFKANAFTAFSEGALCVTTTIACGSKSCKLYIAVRQEETGATVAGLLVTYNETDYGEALMTRSAK